MLDAFPPYPKSYPFLGSYLLHCYATLQTKDQLNAERLFLMNDFEAVPVEKDHRQQEGGGF